MDKNIGQECICWCNQCRVPVIKTHINNFYRCPLCESQITYMSKDIRPVFPEERLLFEIIMGVPNKFIKSSVWCSNSTYFVNGVPYKVTSEMWKNINANSVRMDLEKYKGKNSYEYFDKYKKRFILLNQLHFRYIRFEAMHFIKNVSSKYNSVPQYISFSGGKDSTVVADLVVKALGNPSMLHIFCDTTLEYPFTLNYVKRLKENNSFIILRTAKNNEHDFYTVCDDIGTPSRMKRWCCTIFKTGPISKLVRKLFGDRKLMYFNGLRGSESNVRSKYQRLSDSKSQKIQSQLSASPIINWKDIDVWLYILSEDIDFNDAYRLGFPRVGCFCCPNGSLRNEILGKIYSPEQSNQWNDYLLSFAKKTGIDNPEKYVSEGFWKAKQGGSGIKTYDEVSLNNKVCTIDENAKLYEIGKEISDEFYTMFTPFGKVCRQIGKKILNETLVIRNGLPIISIQIRDNQTVKIKTMNVKKHEDLHRKIFYQITKYKLCRRCYKCETVCPSGAIKVTNNNYIINEKLCTHCMICAGNKYISDGCMMRRYLRVKKGKSNE